MNRQFSSAAGDIRNEADGSSTEKERRKKPPQGFWSRVRELMIWMDEHCCE